MRFGARRWIARIMITWGIIATAMMLVRTPLQFYVLRVLLGVAEAGFFPGIVYYLSQWFPAEERARAGARFMIAIPLSGAVGGPLGGWLLGFDGAYGLAGWQWLFLVEGLPAVVLGVVVLRWLTERPDDASWLEPAQRAWLVSRLRAERSAHPHGGMPPLRALASPAVWAASLPYFLMLVAWYGFVFWVPTLVRDALGSSDVDTGLVLGGIAVVAALALLAVGTSSDRTGERPLHAAACCAAAAAGFALAALGSTGTLRVLGLTLAQAGVMAFLAPFWVLPTIILSGGAAAVGIALVNAIGSVGGFVGPNVVGVLRDLTGSDTRAMLVLSVTTLVAAMLCAALRWHPALRQRS
jgi:ACS family tartrate transporter-like MFS transporter